MIRYLVIITLSWSAAACSVLTSPDRFPDDPAPVSGTIVGRNQPINIAPTGPTMFVKGASVDPCGVWFTLSDRTDIRQRNADSRLERRGIEDLVMGREVNVWTDIVLDSCPQQARAHAIEIL